jgi:hypothetical protein
MVFLLPRVNNIYGSIPVDYICLHPKLPLLEEFGSLQPGMFSNDYYSAVLNRSGSCGPKWLFRKTMFEFNKSQLIKP